MVLLVIFLETKPATGRGRSPLNRDHIDLAFTVFLGGRSLGDRADYLPSGCVREWEIPIYGNISRDEDDGDDDDDDDFTEQDTFSKWIETSWNIVHSDIRWFDVHQPASGSRLHVPFPELIMSTQGKAHLRESISWQWKLGFWCFWYPFPLKSTHFEVQTKTTTYVWSYRNQGNLTVLPPLKPIDDG